MLIPACNTDQRGFSLIESILTIVIIGIALVALISSWSLSAKRGSDPFWHAKTVYLAQAYFEEIMTKRYDENSPEGGKPPCTAMTCSATLGAEGETRATFDDVDDYNGLNEAPSENALGIVRPEYQNYRIKVDVSYAHNDFSRAVRSVKRVDISVTPPGQPTQHFVVYRGNF